MTGILLGRDSELAQVEGLLAAARAGAGRVAFIAGEPGLGKTRLAAAAAARAETAGVRVHWGRCREEGGTPAHWPWVQVLRALTRETDSSRLAAAAGLGAPFLCAAVPELAERLGGPAAGAAAATRFAFFDAVETFLRNLSSVSPLMLILDDLHAADASSLALLEYIAPELSHSHILLVATYREHEASQGEAGPVVARAVRFGERIRLTGLGTADVQRLVAETAGGAVSPRLADAIHRTTEGNPLFVQEMVRTFAAKGRLGEDDELRYIELADSVHHVIATRLEPLSAAAREVLAAAAVIGRAFDVATLEATTNTTAYEILTHVQAAVDAGIASLSGGVRGEAAFAHALYREFFYTALPAAERAALHTRVAAALERQNEEANLPEIAFHLLEAGPVASTARAAEYSMRAGDQAAARFGYAQAVKHYEDALQAIDAAAGGKETRCELLLRLGVVRFRAGSGETSKSAFRAAAEGARDLGDAQRLGRAAIGLAGPWPVSGGIVRDEVVSALEGALVLLGDRDAAMRATLLARLVVELFLSGVFDRCDSMCKEALDLAGRSGDSRALGEALLARQHVAVARTEPLVERRDYAQEVVRLGSELGDEELAFRGRFQLVNVLMEAGDRAALNREISAAARVAERLRQPFYLWFVAAWRSVLALVDGRLEEAESLITNAFTSGCQVQGQEELVQFATPVYQIQIFNLRLERGRGLDELEPAWRATVDSVPIPVFRFFLAYLLSALERWTEARDQLDHLAADDFAALPRDWTRFPSIAFAAEPCADLGDVERARALYERGLAYSAHHISNGSYYLGSMQYYLGRLAATIGRDSEAVDHFEAALGAHRRMGARCWVTRTQVQYGGLLLRSSDSRNRRRAGEMLRQALERAHQIGMDGMVAAAERLLAAVPEGKRERPADRKLAGSEGGERAVFLKTGDLWTIEFAGVACQITDSRGLQYLQQLLRYPGREFHVTELVQAVLGSQVGSAGRNVEVTPGSGSSSTLGDAGPALDAQAAAAYRRRLEELREELAEAEGFSDVGRSERARQEIDFLSTELVAAARGRKSASHGERARLAVTKGIKAALAKLHRNHPELGRHLDATIKRGYFCSYNPDPRHPITWVVG